ncbi:hypothetical protein FRC04_004576 [Tulasnella sp. 424]|nr:hypothetical protein FRC04_004576 [Tulasnella sp. 424]KAG8976645.1 hypothetical protein FRC05_003484 [Tulasnella sp. 425]
MDQSFLPKSFVTSDLRCLVLRWISGVRERDFEGLVQVVAASPGLEELELVGWWPVGPINVVPVRRDLTLDRLGKLRIRKFPWQWALSLLDATHIPQTCISDISLEVSEAGSQVDGPAPFKLFKTELHQAVSLAITLDKSLPSETVGLACTTRHASRIEIKFTWSPSDQPGEGPSSLVGSLVDEISKEVQNLHLPLSLYIACEFPKADHANATEPFLSSLTVADPLLPSVTRVKLKGWSLSLFLEHSKLHQFTNLSTLEIESVKDESLLNDLAKWIRARSQLAKSEPNAVMLKTVTLPCKKLPPAVMNNISLLLGDLVDLNWY